MSGGVHNPKNVFLLCRNFGLELQDLQLVCVFCTEVLSDVDVVSFAYKELYLVWKKGFPYAACSKCLVLAAKFRQYRHWQHSAYASTIEAETGVCLDNILVRCYLCRKPLCAVEKAKHVELQRRYHKISGHWRGTCLQCWGRCADPSPL
ncbi:E6 [Macaca fuscata papillomavirus 2]|uniref:Protein E6 n=1 Tax=Macaca fuscata papillomavirus 2 TaxID=2506204 RepID=A0A3R5T5Q3_9PAPI|nr:E6 [Macaca fuscata papillomavirus 2]